VPIALFGLSGGGELGAAVTAVWMMIGMLLLSVLAYLVMRFPSDNMKLIFTVAAFLVCMLFQPWFCFVPSPNPENDGDIATMNGTFFRLGCCWLAVLGFAIYCFRRSSQKAALLPKTNT
jgi:hypothetical protein